MNHLERGALSRSRTGRVIAALLACASLWLLPPAGARAEDSPPEEAPGDTPKEAPPTGDVPGADVKAIVVTFDSGMVDAGIAGDSAPRLSEPYELSNGRISDWAGFEAMLRRVFQKLGASPAEHPVLLSESMGWPAAEREKLTTLMFETFKVPLFYLAIDGVLACYAAGRTTCLVLSSSGNTQSLAVYEGYALPHSFMEVPVGRREIAQYAMKLMGDRVGHKFGGTSELAAFTRLVEEHGYVAYDFDAEKQRSEASSELEQTVELPNGQSGVMGAERFTAPEALFKPSLIGFEADGVHVAANDTALKCDVDLRKDLFGNIVITGRALTLRGLTERLTKEMANLIPPTMKPKVIVLAPGQDGVWAGGSILSSLATFKAMWVTRKDFETSGPSIIGKKAF